MNEIKPKAIIKEKYKENHKPYDDSEYVQAPKDVLRKAMNKTLTSAIQSCIYC